jgi:hypothetical protein
MKLQVYIHAQTHTMLAISLQIGHVEHQVDVMQLCITGATELIYSEIVSWVSL